MQMRICKYAICLFLCLPERASQYPSLDTYLSKWVEWFLLCYLKQCLSNILKIWGNYPLVGVIIQLITKKLQCRHGFLETRENKF